MGRSRDCFSAGICLQNFMGELVMVYEFYLTRTGVGENGSLTWDSVAGTLAGELAEEVESTLGAAEQLGYITSHPYPTHYDLKDPRHDPGEFGLVLSRSFVIPESLQALTGPLIKPSPPLVSEDGLHYIF